MSENLTTQVEELFTDIILTPNSLQAIGDIEMFTEIIPKGMITCIHAASGVGKSTLVATQIKKILVDNQDLEVIYLDYDQAKVRNRQMLLTLLDNFGSRFKPIDIRNQEIEDKAKSILSSLTDLSKYVIVIDALQGMFNRAEKDINKASDASKIMEAIKVYQNKGATVIIVHHSNKVNNQGITSFRGSMVIQDSVDNLFCLYKLTRGGNVLKAKLDIDIKRSFETDEVELDYSMTRDLDYSINRVETASHKVKLPKTMTQEQLDYVKCVIHSLPTSTLLVVEKHLSKIMKVGLGKVKTMLKYLVEVNVVTKESIEGSKSNQKCYSLTDVDIDKDTLVKVKDYLKKTVII